MRLCLFNVKICMKTRILSFVVALVAAFSASAAVSADKVMQQASATLTSPASVTVTFAVQNGGQSGNGVVVMSNKRYNMTLGAMKIWYDGKTQWTANSNTSEVSITTPTEEEICESNPFVVLSNYKQAYNCKLAKSSSSGVYTITLTPKNNKTMLKSGTVTVSSKNWHPIKITGVTRSGEKFTLSINSIKAGGKLADSNFKFKKGSTYKDYEVIDLR